MTERIVAAAIRYLMPADAKQPDPQPIIMLTERPGRHHHVIHGLHALTGLRTHGGNEQGFLTNTGRFVGRREACEIARAADQIAGPKEGNPAELYSEDLW